MAYRPSNSVITKGVSAPISVFLRLAAACAAGFVLFFLLRQFTQSLGSGDAPIYQAMAEHPFKFTWVPHGYRILIPWLAHAIMALTGASVATAFLVISSSLFAALVTVLVGWVIYIEGADKWLSVQMALLFACSYAGSYNVHNFIHVGLGEYFILVAGFAAIRAERFGAVLALAAIGGLVKESTAALVPVWFVYEIGKTPWRQLLRRTLLLVGAVLAVFAVVRASLHTNAVLAHADVSTVDYVGARLAFWCHPHDVAMHVRPYTIAMRISDAFGTLWPLAAAGFLCADARARRLAVLVPLALAQILVAGDVSRMAATALPAVLFFAWIFLRRLPQIGQVALTLLAITEFLADDYRLPVTRWLLLSSYLSITCALVWTWFHAQRQEEARGME